MQTFAFLSLISSIIVLALGIFVFSTNRNSPLNRIFLFLCIMAFYWAFAESMLRDADSLTSAFMWLKLTAFWTFVPAATFHFILFFTKSDLVRKGRWFYFLIYAPAALFTLIELTTSLITTTPLVRYWGYTYGYSSSPLLFFVELAWAFGILVVSLFITIRHYFQVPDIQEKSQTKYILAGISVVVIASFASQVMLPAAGVMIPELDTIFIMVFSGFIGYAIHKHDLFIVSPATAADNIFSTMTDSLILLDTSHTIISVNEATQKVLGYHKEDLIGLPFSAIFSTPSDSEVILSKIASDGPVTDLETAYRSKDGTTVPVSFSGSIIRNAQGDRAGVVCISRNITRRKKLEDALRENEKRFRDLAEQFPELMLESDMQGNPAFINRYAYEVLGYSEEDVRKGLSVFDLVIPEDRERLRQNLTKLLNGEVLRGNEYTALKKDGTRFPVILYSAPIVSFGKITGFRAFAGDITERKRAEAAFQQATKKLSLLNQITLSDIQNAVFLLEGYMELATLPPAGTQGDDYPKKEREIVRKMAGSLKFARSYQNIGQKPAKWQDVNHVFLMAISHLDFSKIARNLNLDTLQVYADPLLESVFFTLAENVILHATTATEVSFWYRESGRNLTLVFEDNGPGIPKEKKEKIFQRDFAEKNGPDLFLAREILSITGITIAETGESGRGARFEITVPKGAYRFGDQD
jgi:PAS domain S-box-containing protein